MFIFRVLRESFAMSRSYSMSKSYWLPLIYEILRDHSGQSTYEDVNSDALLYCKL